MNFRYQLLGAFILFLAFISCEPEEEKIVDSSGLSIVFSADTIQFDTVITGSALEVSNITKRLMAYNPNSRAVNISSIMLAGGQSSPYQLFINGTQSHLVNNLTLFGGDSLLILIELRNDSKNRDLPYLIKDSILFQLADTPQEVKLIAYGQDAHFIDKGFLSCSEVWESGRAYVLKDTVWVGEGCSLTITKGAQIYFNNYAALMVEGTLKVIGEKGERVRFNNSRLDIKNQVGLWSGIHFLGTSHDNEILFSNIRNSGTAIFLEIVDEDTIPDLVIGNSTIENTAGPGIFARNSDLYVYNTLVNNSPGYIIENIAGGNYTYEHCTLVNYATLGFSSNLPVALFSDRDEDDENIQPLNVKLYNNIIWSGRNLSDKSDLHFNITNEGDFNLEMGNNLIRSTEEAQDINDNIISLEEDFPDFEGIFQFNYHIDSLSPAIDKGKPLNLLIDLDGNERDILPDIGAYEYKKE